MTELVVNSSGAVAVCAVAGVAFGAALGGALRYALAELAFARTRSKLPGTWIANMSACLVAGIAGGLWAQASSVSGAPTHWDTGALAYTAITVGFAGGLSTWSTLAAEILNLARTHFWRAMSYTTLTLLVGAVFAFAGL